MNDDFFELPSEDIDINDNKGKQNREDGLDLLFKILDKEEIQYDTVSDGKRNFINNQIGILGDYKLAISVDPNTDMKKFCSYLNKELIKYGCHISRDNYNTLTLSYDKSLLVKEQEMRNYNTIVFDIGGVLIERKEINPLDLRKLGIYDEIELRELMIIYYDIANENDTATYKEILDKYKKALPDRFKSKAKELINISMAKRVCKYTVPLLKELKSKGYKLYYLSNASKHRHEVSKKNGLLNFLEYFDGGMFSYKEGVEKPNPEFYNRLLRKYKLKASDCLFIDDNPNNIETAQNLGFKTLYYNNPKNIDLYSIIESATIVNEVNIFINQDNIEYNCDTLAPNTNNNILFITGYSGAGKSTLMANLSEKYGNNIMTVSGDTFFQVCRYKYRIDRGDNINQKKIDEYGFNNKSKQFIGPIISKYFNLYYDNIKLTNDEFDNKELFVYWEHFIKWLYNDTITNKTFYRNKIVVIEGIQISNTDPELYRNHALIIVGTSALTAWARKANRDIFSKKKYDWKHIKTLFTMIPLYVSDYNRLNNLGDMMEESTELALPEDNTLVEILDNTSPDNIYLTSDWHLFKNHYKHEANYVNTQKIIKWCKDNIKDNDVFFYLGDISFRWANEEDQEESMKIMASLPGIKVLILGNHDKMLGQDYFTNCGFKYVFEEYQWKDYIFTHKPINMSMYQDNMLNIHGHIHNMETYNTTDGKRNVNVYPMWYNNKPVTLSYIISHVEELTKDHEWNPNYGYGESALLENRRSELPDSSFGIPEDRKYPLDTEQHVKSAIKLFGHAEESKKKSLAKRINAAAKKYDISIPETTQCYKYLSEGGFYDMIPEDINTIVFDMGGVLVNSDIEGAIHNGLHVSHLLAHEIQDLILDNILCCEPKDKRIKTCSLDCIKKYFYNIAPDNIKPYTDDVLRLLNNALFKYAYVDELISILKAKGYSIYYLSNWFGWSYELEKEFFAPLLSKFDGGLFSFETNYEKPQEEFYKIFFNKFNLDPKTCLFFDDKAENISAGERLGMRGIIFNPEETPKQLLDGNFNIPSDANNKILVSNGVNLEAVNISQIRWWHCSKYNNLNDFNHYDNNEFYRTIDEAIKKNTIESDYANGPIERYLYSYTGDMDEDYYQRFIVGAIQVNPDYTYEWTIQYPLESDEDGNLTSRLSEWAMASCNPIKGISKPFILKVTPDNNSTINPKLYAFSPDIIADKYLVVNENAQLEIVDSNRFNNCVIESYEFIGDNQEYLVNKIYKAYKEHKIVDNTFFYTTLTGKPMLCEDQMDYDALFSKANVDLIIENISTELATFKEQVTNIIYNDTTTLPVLESVANKVPFASHYKDIIMKEDIDGYYFYNSLTGKRTRSIKDIKSLTETMIISTL